MKIFWATSLALIAFAANSVLCRLALGSGLIDAASFTTIRLLSGALMLYVLVTWQSIPTIQRQQKGSWLAGLMLFVYALTFSYAYVSLDTGVGAMILFGTIQVSMIGFALWQGDKLKPMALLGLSIAIAGFVYLMLPGASAPSWSGFMLMMVSGLAWSVYTLKGYGSTFPLADTAFNFIRTIPLVLLVLVFTWQDAVWDMSGVLLAVLSGAIASGLGYTLWYMALKGLSTMQTAVLQLLVPVIAALGGVIFVSETLTMRLMIAAALILGGTLLLVLQRDK